MGRQLVEKLIPALERMAFPPEPVATAIGHKVYEVSIQKTDEYENDPRDLLAAIKAVQTGDSQPYAFAGVAYVLIAASREADGEYYQPGLAVALEWLEKAQATEPDILEINVWEAVIYTYRRRFEDARLVLDYLAQQDPANFLLTRAEIAYWQHLNDVPMTETWLQKAIASAPTGMMQVHMQRQLADFYASANLPEKAVEAYRRVLHFHPTDGQIWHQLSLQYLQLQNLEEAEHSNRQALAHQGPAEAQRVTQQIERLKKEDRKGWRSLLG